MTTKTYSNAHWLAFSANRSFHKDPRIVVSSHHHHLTDDQGRQIYDSLSGLWTCGAGHTRSVIGQAVTKQLSTLDYSPAFQYAHTLSFELADKIVELMPEGLNHVLFTGSGSECADTAVKLAKAYWRIQGKASKTKFIGRMKGYHGVNLAGTSLGGIGGNRKIFGQFLDVDH
ncbi:aminotransferase class III-fold pyridoxal phosphate-dependent enzyme [Acinetobacter sp. EC24]|nr:aminotransferase class III-fold pyridoxal phosphate-dependent enzyme [Acinetobacter rathckeae]